MARIYVAPKRGGVGHDVSGEYTLNGQKRETSAMPCKDIHEVKVAAVTVLDSIHLRKGLETKRRSEQVTAGGSV